MVPPKGVYLLSSKLHLILALANLLAHNNITISYYLHYYYYYSKVINFSSFFIFTQRKWLFSSLNVNVFYLDIYERISLVSSIKLQETVPSFFERKYFLTHVN